MLWCCLTQLRLVLVWTSKRRADYRSLEIQWQMVFVGCQGLVPCFGAACWLCRIQNRTQAEARMRAAGLGPLPQLPSAGKCVGVGGGARHAWRGVLLRAVDASCVESECLGSSTVSLRSV